MFFVPMPQITPSLLARPLVLGLIVALIYATLVALGLTSLQLWSQVTYQWTRSAIYWGWDWNIPPDWRSDPPECCFAFGGHDQTRLSTQAHVLRIVLTYPLFWVGDRTGIDPNRLYTALLPILAAGTVWFAAQVVRHQSPVGLSGRALPWLVPLAAVFFFMEGRLVLAYFGYALMLYLYLGRAPTGPVRMMLGTSLALLFASVSSGTFWAVFLIFLLLSSLQIIHLYRSGRVAPIALLDFIVPIVFTLLLYHNGLASGLLKNMEFYGGGVASLFRMLDHGLGLLPIHLEPSPLLFAGVGVLGLLFLWLTLYIARRAPQSDLFLVLSLTIALGTLGLSILTLSLIPFCTFTAALASDRKIGQRFASIMRSD